MFEYEVLVLNPAPPHLHINKMNWGLQSESAKIHMQISPDTASQIFYILKGSMGTCIVPSGWFTDHMNKLVDE